MFLPETELVRIVNGMASMAAHKTADQQIRDEQQIFVVEEQGGYETDATQYEAQGIGLFAGLEQW